jgi:hypothetical protein
MIPIFNRKQRGISPRDGFAAAMIAILMVCGCGKKDEFAGNKRVKGKPPAE